MAAFRLQKVLYLYFPIRVHLYLHSFGCEFFADKYNMIVKWSQLISLLKQLNLPIVAALPSTARALNLLEVIGTSSG